MRLKLLLSLAPDSNQVSCSKARPKPEYPRVRILPILNDDGKTSDPEATPEKAFIPRIRTAAPMDRMARRRNKLHGQSVLSANSSPAVNVFEESEKIVRAREKPIIAKKLLSPIESTGEVKSLSVILRRETVPTLSSFRQQNLDIFQVRGFIIVSVGLADRQIFSTAAFPPWSIQCSIFDELKSQTRGSILTPESADAHFHLSICYLTGFGVEPAASEVLHNIRKAVYSNTIARSIHRRVEMAYDEQAKIEPNLTTAVDDQLEYLMSDPLYFSHRLRLHQKNLSQNVRQRLWKCDSVQFTLSDLPLFDSLFHDHDCHQPCVNTDTPGVIARRNNLLDLVAEAGSDTVIERLIEDQTWSDQELGCALTIACEYGQFATAKCLAYHCPQLQYEEVGPSPLHWLIMFDQDEAKQLASLLILGSSDIVESANGVCKGMVNAMPRPGSEPYTLSEHCLQLTGSPLHWAVGTRNLALVTFLIELGANIHLRWSYTSQHNIEFSTHQRPDLTPFELAVAWHLPEICEVLWKATPSSHQAKLIESSTTFHSIGQHGLPFLRYIIHGANHVQALRDTIGMLLSWGFDIQCKNKLRESAFMAALKDPDQEIYILREIMSSSDCNDEITLDGKNAVTLVAATSSRRRYSTQRMILAAERVSSINDTDHSGRNALHYVAAEDNAKICDVLLQSNTLDINKRDTHGETAAHISAASNAGMILKLLVHRGADIEILNSARQTPLTVAILHRQKIAIRILIEAGADMSLGNHGGSTNTTALHAAISEQSFSDSIASHLLENYHEFRDPLQLDLVDEHGWTPLHRAAYFGDYQGVAALLDYGANSEARTSSHYRMAQGQTALDITDNLLKSMAESCLRIDHPRVREGDEPGLATFQLHLEEVKLILAQKRKDLGFRGRFKKE